LRIQIGFQAASANPENPLQSCASPQFELILLWNLVQSLPIWHIGFVAPAGQAAHFASKEYHADDCAGR
jgi:hypothetical protein